MLLNNRSVINITKTLDLTQEQLNKIKEECYHFQLFLDGEGNEAVVLEKILELQKEGKKMMDYKSFINGNQNLVGKKFI